MSLAATIVVGKVGAPYGVKGWLKIHSFTEPPQKILQYPDWQLLLQGRWQLITIAQSQLQGDRIVVRFADVIDRDVAARYTHASIAVPKQQLAALPKGQFYWHDLLGLNVFNKANVYFGQIDHILETGANDVLVVKGERQRLIPWVLSQVILQVDLVNKKLLVDWDAEF